LQLFAKNAVIFKCRKYICKLSFTSNCLHSSQHKSFIFITKKNEGTPSCEFICSLSKNTLRASANNRHKKGVLRRGTEKSKKTKEVSNVIFLEKETGNRAKLCCSSNEDVTSCREEVVPKGICELKTR